MRILLISSAYNGLTQRAHVELDALGHEVSITLSLSPDEIIQAVTLFGPDLVICPFLRERIPAEVWQRHTCIVIHPGIKGDRGPSSLDWAITDGWEEWGVTALQAIEEMDAGDIWASSNFPMRRATKASIYRREVTRSAVSVICDTIARVADRSFRPEPLDYGKADVRGSLRPLMKQQDRAIDWQRDTTARIITKINAADSNPGLLDILCADEYYLYGAHDEEHLRGPDPGAIIARRHGAICRATVDGAVWISHLKRKNTARTKDHPWWQPLAELDFKLPASLVLGDALARVPESPIEPLYTGTPRTFREIWYEEHEAVGYLHFDFHNGAMSTEQCRRLREAYGLARQRPTRVIVLMGGRDFWSNGIHLNIIEAADNPAEESWRNINAIDDVVLDIITTETHLTIAAIWGTAGAGGAMMPLAADRVSARAGCIMNPHYRTMGLYGSEYWTYLLPRRVGPARALELTQNPLPIGMHKARAIGMIDDILPDDYDEFRDAIHRVAVQMATAPDFADALAEKNRRRLRDEQSKPLAMYRAAELTKMKMNFSGQFFGGEQNYHQARYNFVHKIRPCKTAEYLAKHFRLDFEQFKELRQPPTY